jgi:hypothetical protein
MPIRRRTAMSDSTSNDGIDLDAIQKRADYVERWDVDGSRSSNLTSLAAYDVPELIAEVVRLRAAITQHRDVYKRSKYEPQDDVRELVRFEADERLWSVLDDGGDS